MSDQGGYEGVTWVKSSLSFCNGNCVELADLPNGKVGIRDSKDPAGTVIEVSWEDFQAFRGGMKRGDFDQIGR
jgi:hypothetical protein